MMDDNTPHHDGVIMTKAREHKFFIMIAGSIVVALLLVGVALGLYHESGADGLDLSRPGYSDIRKELPKDDGYKGFPSDGDLDKEALKDFDKQYDEQLGKIKKIDTFSGDPLSQESLQIAVPEQSQDESAN